jgi:hypothetical protein
MKDATPQGYRTVQIWSILVFAAQHQEIVTYATIQKLTGLPRNGLKEYLDLIHAYCEPRKYPDLWTIAVNEKTGFPGVKSRTQHKILCDQRRVFAFNWFKDGCCPQPKNFK